MLVYRLENKETRFGPFHGVVLALLGVGDILTILLI